MMSTKRSTLLRVLSETSHIISSHPCHFLALSIFFIFPISFSTTIPPFRWLPTSFHSLYIRFFFGVGTLDLNIFPSGESHLQIQLLYSLVVLIFNFYAVSSITRSALHGFHKLPFNFVSSIRYTLVSFFPLLTTKLVHMIILGSIYFAFSIFMYLPDTVLPPLGLYMDHNSVYYLVFVFLIATLLTSVWYQLGLLWCLMNPIVVLEYEGGIPLNRSSCLVKWMRRVMSLMLMFFGILSASYANFMANYAGAFLVGLLTYLGLEWCLMDPLILEYSQWGFAPLKRSSLLMIKGMLKAAFWMTLFFGILYAILAKWHMHLMANEGRDRWVVVQTVVYAALLTILSLYNLVADVVLFVYCKELHGEVDENSGGDYIIWDEMFRSQKDITSL